MGYKKKNNYYYQKKFMNILISLCGGKGEILRAHRYFMTIM